MSEKETKKVKPAKYDDAETKKPGSPIETPYKHGDARNKKLKEADDIAVLDDLKSVVKLTTDGELKVVKTNG